MASENLWEIPEPASVCEVRPDGDTVITLRRYGNPAGARLVLSHGNGLAIDLYFPFWSLLRDDYDLVLYDLRNHGRNHTGTIENHNVPAFVRDHNCVLAAIDEQYGEKPKIGVFHSASSLITLMSSSILAIPALTLESSAFSALVLFDPPLCKPGASQEKFDDAAEKMAAMTRRRTNRFQSREQYVELLGFMPSFRRVIPGVRELLAALVAGIRTMSSAIAIQRVSWRDERPVDYRAVQGALNVDGLGNMVSGLAGTVPGAAITTSVSMTELNGVAARNIGIVTGATFIILAFVPKLVAVVLAIPDSVFAGYLFIMLALLFMIGMKMIIDDGVDTGKGLLIGIAFLAGTGCQYGLIFPAYLDEFAGGLLRNGMNAGGFTIILMTLIMELVKPRGK